MAHASRPGISFDVADIQNEVHSSIVDTASNLTLSRVLDEEEDAAQDVAVQIATARQQQSFEDAYLLPSQYKISAPCMESPLHITTAEHRKTGVARDLATFHKPTEPGARERLRSVVTTLQQVSETSDGMVKILDVYEDPFKMHLLQEHCSGGSVYERILERQHFTEQECAVLVKHMLLSLLPLHDSRIFHGSLSPTCFHFLSSAPQAPLKLVDFGLDLKTHWWDDLESTPSSESKDPSRRIAGSTSRTEHHLRCVHLFEPCKLVFCPPEFAPDYLRVGQKDAKAEGAADSKAPKEVQTVDDGDSNPLTGDVLADVIDQHVDWLCEQTLGSTCDYQKKFEGADVWSIGAITFLLLCGYPPFYAAHRNAILRRLHNCEYTYDAPFWSKISDEAKDFVSSCLTKVCWERPSIREALAHPWIQNLADTSVLGPMLSSFMLNLRRFHRTGMMEVYCANILSRHFRREDVSEFLKRCRELDSTNAGFVTPLGLRQVLTSMRFEDVADTINIHFQKALRHPGESYIDYVALLDSIHLRQQWLFKEDLWKQFQKFCQANFLKVALADAVGRDHLHVSDIKDFLGDPMVLALLTREVPQQAGIEQATIQMYLRSCIEKRCQELHSDSIGFDSMAATLLQSIRGHANLVAFQRQRDADVSGGGNT
eukprot:CAMPEP_0178391542 /NCGR_PEP_ID=MMETSP0689_2-20121128/11219_1 /TAXON_ID=160604 /ORGANISM="Amphidinium massartii, Strain CS-259" /LENGTH=655 /DNA_ID=CAMNT_0020012093 /DNA_START=151 /DNA_END=2114 /DNA_ORIENTATION=-